MRRRKIKNDLPLFFITMMVLSFSYLIETTSTITVMTYNKVISDLVAESSTQQNESATVFVEGIGFITINASKEYFGNVWTRVRNLLSKYRHDPQAFNQLLRELQTYGSLCKTWTIIVGEIPPNATVSGLRLKDMIRLLPYDVEIGGYIIPRGEADLRSVPVLDYTIIWIERLKFKPSRQTETLIGLNPGLFEARYFPHNNSYVVNQTSGGQYVVSGTSQYIHINALRVGDLSDYSLQSLRIGVVNPSVPYDVRSYSFHLGNITRKIYVATAKFSVGLIVDGQYWDHSFWGQYDKVITKNYPENILLTLRIWSPRMNISFVKVQLTDIEYNIVEKYETQGVTEGQPALVNVMMNMYGNFLKPEDVPNPFDIRQDKNFTDDDLEKLKTYYSDVYVELPLGDYSALVLDYWGRAVPEIHSTKVIFTFDLYITTWEDYPDELLDEIGNERWRINVISMRTLIIEDPTWFLKTIVLFIVGVVILILGVIAMLMTGRPETIIVMLIGLGLVGVSSVINVNTLLGTILPLIGLIIVIQGIRAKSKFSMIIGLIVFIIGTMVYLMNSEVMKI